MLAMLKMLFMVVMVISLMVTDYGLNLHMVEEAILLPWTVTVVTVVVESRGALNIVDHMRRAGDVCFSEVFRDGRGTTGIVDYTNYDDMKYAVRKLDDSEFRNAFSRAYIRVREYDRRRRLSRSRSRSYSRSRSPSHSHSYGRSSSHSRRVHFRGTIKIFVGKKVLTRTSKVALRRNIYGKYGFIMRSPNGWESLKITIKIQITNCFSKFYPTLAFRYFVLILLVDQLECNMQPLRDGRAIQSPGRSRNSSRSRSPAV
ncbi:hypothetical protein COCNU_01G001790 [Cocos nucifera]|uniref:Uncharacterized protein n=1 Tax=Cocos nucifera TaxID=13894 RepID=A0A8K0MUA9_COCNU|nr:hypothetical protein COCNU_01G001790 [Cocos nucifera]